MRAKLRCDRCAALHWYGKPMHTMLVTEFPAGDVRTIHMCAVCAEYYAEATWPEDAWGPYQPTMHRPHESVQ